MKKIMFNDKYRLTEAVLLGRKTQTRRIIECPKKICGTEVYGFHAYRRASTNVIEEVCCFDDDESDIEGGQILPKYKIGEIVAIAQSYSSIVDELEDPKNFCCMEHWESASGDRAHYCGYLEHPGFTNKMFVSADKMPHQIRITNVRIERLQDISHGDCKREGIELSATENRIGYPFGIPFKYFFGEDKPGCRYTTPREAYASLIDKISGKGTWESNPFVFVYDFELVK